MAYYRLVAMFEPGHPRLTGSRSTNTKRGQRETSKRGAWRVLETYPWEGMPRVFFGGEALPELFAVSPRPLRVGTLCNPFKLLKEALAAKNA